MVRFEFEDNLTELNIPPRVLLFNSLDRRLPSAAVSIWIVKRDPDSLYPSLFPFFPFPYFLPLFHSTISGHICESIRAQRYSKIRSTPCIRVRTTWSAQWTLNFRPVTRRNPRFPMTRELLGSPLSNPLPRSIPSYESSFPAVFSIIGEIRLRSLRFTRPLVLAVKRKRNE